ncbi:MAG: acyltransferase [Chitinophagaceae bacterium]|nr:MAG: acyltransferase [Chitinophagaceae bacterium]
MSDWIQSKFRPKLLRLAGVKIGKSHIGQGVIFDSLYPEDIEIGNKTAITFRCVIITHFMEPLPNGERDYVRGKVKIGDYVFIGAHTLITKPVTIGDYSIVAAGSVVTKDIPPCEVWGGVPAKFIKKRELDMSCINN